MVRCLSRLLPIFTAKRVSAADLLAWSSFFHDLGKLINPSPFLEVAPPPPAGGVGGCAAFQPRRPPSACSRQAQAACPRFVRPQPQPRACSWLHCALPVRPAPVV